MSSSNSNPPCAACKFLRRKCLPGCVFSPYFPPEEPQKFVNVHKIFGASNVSKLLSEIQPHQREDAVNSLAYEAEARLKDPVYGCVGAISVLQTQVLRLQKELEATNADLMRFASANNNNNNNNAAEIMSTSSSSGYSPVGKPAAAAGNSLNGHRSLSFNLQRMTMAGGGHPHNMAMMMQLQQQNGRSRMTEGGDCGGGGLQLHNYAPSQGMTTTDYYYSSAWSNSSSGGEHNSDGADNGDCSM